MGFHASASSETSRREAYKAFNNMMGTEGAWISGDGVTAWLEIRCPEPVIIWRIALAPLHTIPAWNLSASNDGLAFTPLFSSTAALTEPIYEPFSSFFNISTTTAYQYYRLTIPENDDELLTGIKMMQLFVYDT